MRTTIELPDPLFRNARAVAAEKGMTLKAFFTEALSHAINNPEGKTRRMVRPPIMGNHEMMIPARTNEELAALLEAEDITKVQ